MKGKAAKEKTQDNKGLTTDKEDFSEWFTQIMLKADLADYTNVSGCIVFKPKSYFMWEKIVAETDKKFKEIGIKNAYFPLFISEKTLMKEAENFEGFTPEVAWVTHAGETKLNEKLAIRPTSETIMYESYSKWIRSWRDLPLKLNQWNNVVRWEFKHPVPFLRTREFLWNEGHTVFATKQEAEAEKNQILSIYNEVCENLMALPSLVGRKSAKETFPGAEYTYSMEFFMPQGKAIQGPDWHHDGQKFAKAYDIKFLNKDGKEEYAYQNTFAITTRMLGVMFAMHSDDKGLILPPKIAPTQAVIVPIYFEDSKSKVLKFSKQAEAKLKSMRVYLDDRDNYKPGYKFNEHELAGVPIRIEIGPKDVEKGEVVVVRRDNGKKESVKLAKLSNFVENLLEDVQSGLFAKAKKLLDTSIVQCKSLDEVEKALDGKKIALAPLCATKDIDDSLKEKTGAKVLNIPDQQPKQKGICVISGKAADYWAYVGRSY